MKESKEYNEYHDKLVSVEVAMLALKAGYPGNSPECYTIQDGVPKEKASIMDEWSGLIGEGWSYLCDRPTQSALQKWIRETHAITVESNFLPNIQKYRCLYKPKSIIPKDLRQPGMSNKEFHAAVHLAIDKYYGKDSYDTYEEALETGLGEALKIITEE